MQSPSPASPPPHWAALDPHNQIISQTSPGAGVTLPGTKKESVEEFL